MDALNTAVTAAIFAAERADYDASVAWFTVRDCEAAILAALPDIPENSLQREIARRGVESARARAMVLRNKKDDAAEKPASCPENCDCPGCFALKREVNRLELRINELVRAVGLDPSENETWPKIIEWVTSAGRLSSVLVVKAKTLDDAADDVMQIDDSLGIRKLIAGRFRHEARKLREQAALVADRGESFGNYLVESNVGYQRAVATLTRERDLAAGEIIMLKREVEKAHEECDKVLSRISDNAPVPVLPLWCPRCGKRHADEGRFAANKHHTHMCVNDMFGVGCQAQWRLNRYVYGSAVPESGEATNKTSESGRGTGGHVSPGARSVDPGWSLERGHVLVGIEQTGRPEHVWRDTDHDDADQWACAFSDRKLAEYVPVAALATALTNLAHAEQNWRRTAEGEDSWKASSEANVASFVRMREERDASKRRAEENSKDCRDAEGAQEKAEENLLEQDRYVRDLRRILGCLLEAIPPYLREPGEGVPAELAGAVRHARAMLANDPQAEASGRAPVVTEDDYTRSLLAERDRLVKALDRCWRIASAPNFEVDTETSLGSEIRRIARVALGGKP